MTAADKAASKASQGKTMTLFRKNLIDGDWVGEAGSRNINPSNTGDVVGEYASSGPAEAYSPTTSPVLEGLMLREPASPTQSPSMRFLRNRVMVFPCEALLAALSAAVISQSSHL